MSNSNTNRTARQIDSRLLQQMADIATRYAVEDDLTGVKRTTDQIGARFVEEYPHAVQHQGMIARMWNALHGVRNR